MEAVRDANGSTLGYTVDECRGESQTSCPDFRPSTSSFNHAWSGAGDTLAIIHHLSNGITWQGGTATFFCLEFSGLIFSPGFGTFPKAPVSTGRGKEGRWLISVLSCKIIQATICEAAYNLIPPFIIWWAWAGRTSWCCLPMGTAVARSSGHVKEEFSPQEEPMCSPSSLYAVIFRWRSKNNHWGVPWKLLERLLCCSPRSLFQNVYRFLSEKHLGIGAASMFVTNVLPNITARQMASWVSWWVHVLGLVQRKQLPPKEEM